MTLHGVAVDCVEIEGRVRAAAEHFPSENANVWTHPRFRLVLDDARSWLRVADVRYDVIVTDCTNIQYRSNGDLYTVDYFRLLRDRLTPDGLAAAWVPANGIRDADLRTLLRSTDQLIRAVFVDEFGDLEKDEALLAEWSPLRDVDKIAVPLFVYQGQNDPRVPRAESDAIVRALRARNLPVEYMIAANEGHSLDRRENQIEFFARSARFLEEHLK
jgi:pimeloyl-ACP methyl ester carboxylesterase